MRIYLRTKKSSVFNDDAIGMSLVS